MNINFTSLFDIYPDKLRKGAVVGFTKPDGTPLEFPCTFDTGDAVKDAKGRWTASGLGLKPVVAKYSGALKHAKAVEAWIGDGFCMNRNAKHTVENATLERIRFVDGVTEIGFCAFADCTALTGFTIPNGVTSIGGCAFFGCSGLTNITIPDGVTEIGCDAFGGCKSLGNVTIPDGVTSIGDWTFHGCSSLTSVTIPNSVTEIGNQAFLGCNALTGITIPDSVTSIGCCAFAYCTALTRVTIPESVAEIENNAFWGCNSLTDIYVNQPESDLLDNVELPAGCTVHWNQTEAV